MMLVKNNKSNKKKYLPTPPLTLQTEAPARAHQMPTTF